MRIGIDARFYGSLGKGLGRYTQKLIEQLELLDNENEYVVFLRAENFDNYQPKNHRFSKVLVDCPWYSLREQWEMPRILGRHNLNLVHFPHFNVPVFYRGAFVVTIHDLILLHFPTIRGTTLPRIFYWLKYWMYTIVIRHAIKASRQIFTVSEFTKSDILKHYFVQEEKIVVTYEACDNFCRISQEKDEEILSRHGIMKPYLLYVGNAYPHKNLERLIRAFGMISKSNSDLWLVLVGKEDFFYRRLKNFVEQIGQKHIRFVGFLSDDNLDVLYKCAKLYVFPSLYEGFGLPPLEAMAKGTVVSASNHLALKEVLGESAVWFDGHKVESIVSAIESGIKDETLRGKKRESGYKTVQKYSWKRMAKETLEFYLKILHSK